MLETFIHTHFSKYPLVAFETSGPAIKLFTFVFFSKANKALKSLDNWSGETGISSENKSGSTVVWIRGDCNISVESIGKYCIPTISEFPVNYIILIY